MKNLIRYLFIYLFRMINPKSLSKIRIGQEENHLIVGKNARKLSKMNRQKNENLRSRNMSKNAKKKLLQPKRNNKFLYELEYIPM